MADGLPISRGCFTLENQQEGAAGLSFDLWGYSPHFGVFLIYLPANTLKDFGIHKWFLVFFVI
jgi:hypothetical protein